MKRRKRQTRRERKAAAYTAKNGPAVMRGRNYVIIVDEAAAFDRVIIESGIS